VTRYLLDTNIVSDLVRNPDGVVAERIRGVGGTRVCTSIIVAAEVRFGAEKKSSKRLAAQIAPVLAAIEILPFAPPADASYALIRSTLEKAGRPMGANDLLIAAHALTLGYTLVTDNEQEFRRVRGLIVENWQRRA
jgi:tRNA(fMet)-specific endonuclease VapC